MLAVCSSISLKIESSNYLLVAIQQAMLAVCMGVKWYLFYSEILQQMVEEKWGNNLKIEIRGKSNENIQQYPKG